MLAWYACMGAGGASNCAAVGGGGRGCADLNEFSIVALTRWYISRSEREMEVAAGRGLVAALVCRAWCGFAGGSRSGAVEAAGFNFCGDATVPSGWEIATP